MNAPSPHSPAFSPEALGFPLLRVQKMLGWLALLFILAAFASLVDGLTAEMRRGPDRLDVVAGSETPLSGPIPVKKAELDDFYVQGNAPDGQVRLVLDDFFASYWFGSGMWRGRIVVGDNPGIGEYHMTVAFRDAPPKGAQNYRVVVWADEDSLREGSFSWVVRTFGRSPFGVAGAFAPVGLLLGAVNFLVGWRRAKLLQLAGCGEVYKVMSGDGGSKKAQAIGAGKKEATFGLGEEHGLALGQRCLVMRPDGRPMQAATVAFCDVRYSSMLLDSHADVRAGDVVFPLQPGMRTPLDPPDAPASQGGAAVTHQEKESTVTARPAMPPVSGAPLAPLRPQSSLTPDVDADKK